MPASEVPKPQGPRFWQRLWVAAQARWTPRTAWGLTIAYMAGIFFLSSRPGEQVAEWPTMGIPSYGWHVILYFGLGILLHGALGLSWGGSFWRVAGAAVALATLYGVTDEVHQMFVPGRHPSAWDVVADGVGAAGGQLVPGGYRLWLLRRQRKRNAAPGSE